MPNSRIAPTTLRALLAASLVLSGPGAGAALTSPALAFAGAAIAARIHRMRG